MIVKKKVHISIMSKREISLTASRNPAITGENRYLALPARDTRPLAFENSSFERIEGYIVDMVLAWCHFLMKKE